MSRRYPAPVPALFALAEWFAWHGPEEMHACATGLGIPTSTFTILIGEVTP